MRISWTALGRIALVGAHILLCSGFVQAYAPDWQTKPGIRGDEYLIYPKESPRFVILEPTGEKKNQLPVLEIFREVNDSKRIVEDLFRTSFMRESVKLYFLAQNYLINLGVLDKHEPAYLLLSSEQGGFPRFGFWLRGVDGDSEKRDVPYIELVKKDRKAEDELASMPQIYPHEMGHVLYQILSGITGMDFPRSSDVHFVSLTTDFRTAFHEGFAIHFENFARQHEPNDSRREAVLCDIEAKKNKIKASIAGFKRDFTLPLRLGYYQAPMLVWYQTFEHLKRYEWVKTGRIRFKNETKKTGNIEKALFYRNSGIALDMTRLRNMAQALATEGVVAAFFNRMMESPITDRYLPESFYRPFLCGAGSLPCRPEDFFSPLENAHLKIFHVMHKHLKSDAVRSPQLLDFVTGYVQEFPEERDAVSSAFRFATGAAVPDKVGPELWLMNKKHRHGFLLLDPFRTHVSPFYAFDLNAADAVDLRTFSDISEEEAAVLIQYREERGFISGLEELDSVPGISKQSAQILRNNVYDPEAMKAFEEGMEINVPKLLLLTIVHPFLRGGAVFIVFSLIHYFFFLRGRAGWNRRPVKRLLLKLPKMILVIFVGLACSAVPGNAAFVFLMAVLLIIALEILFRRDRAKRKDALRTTAMMALLVLYSVW